MKVGEDNLNIDESALKMMINKISELTGDAIYEDNLALLKGHKQNVNTLLSTYEELQTYSRSITDMLINRDKFEKLKTENEKDGLTFQSAIYSIYKDEQNKNREDALILQFFNATRDWGKKGYKEIVSLRKALSGGQELVYDIQQYESTSYRLNEEQYLENINPNLVTWTQNWDKVDGGDIIASLSLQVGTPVEGNYISKSDIRKSKDALYKYLYNNYSSSVNKENGLYTSRLYELYDQIRFTFFGRGEGNYSTVAQEEFTAQLDSVSKFVGEYLEAGMHKDTLPFYQMGDTVENAYTLVENKRAGAAISIKTIRNALIKIRDIFNGPMTKKALQASFTQLFSKVGNSDLEKTLQGAAAKVTEKGIKDFFKSIDAKNMKVTLNS